MNLHEYQAKQILRQFNVSVPCGLVADSSSTVVDAAKKIRKKTCLDSWVVKAQIHSGGRGKAGGVKVVNSLDEISHIAHDMLGSRIVTHQTGPEGKIVRKVLIEQNIYYPGEHDIKELYISVLLNRKTSHYLIVYSSKGGVDIEETAEKNPDLIYQEEIDPKIGLRTFQARKIAFNLGLKGKSINEMVNFITNLFNVFEKTDASLIEINPVVLTSDELIIAADIKFILDDNSLFRHPDLAELRDVLEENEAEVEAGYYGLNFVKLEGNIGCMVNGAGLAMATMDIIKFSGGEPANFLDVGGTANSKTIEAGFRIILKDTSVEAVFINIFGGIVRCDRVAQGIVEACRNIGSIKIPIIFRLQGTNAVEAKKLIELSGIKAFSANTLQEAADLIQQVVK